ncbi:hypothetical protein E4T52_09244 [Aureobasidium sp. EXF-3400]|nr:hypothetical protein E4T51_08370 [Aureobasidium sp. EXF-12344]KAI4775793.1 hypothetical protein E4T52_09244 [Aureobasidium sp. EXF-3400]
MHAFGPRRNATSGPIEFSLELRDLRAENQRLKQYLFSAEPSAPEESETEKGFTKTLGSDGSSGKFAARSVAMEDDPDNEDIPNWKDGIAYLHFGEVQTTPDPAAVEEMEGLSNNFAGEASHWRASGVMSGRRTSNHPLLTWHGLIQDSVDALVVFEACLSGTLQHILRRPYDHERASLIRSGSVFVYAEDTAGIRRWTDGIAWSPSRIIGNFLIYRELEKPQPSSEKKPTIKRKRSSQERSVQATEGYQDSKEVDTSGYHRLPPIPPLPMSPLNSKSSVPGMTDSDDKEKRQLVGPLVDSYGFKLDGLIKKTMSITFEGASHHLVSYYTVEDVKQRKLLRPSNDIRLNGIAIRPELYIKQNFRTPVEEQDQFAVDYSGHAYPQWSGNSDMAVLSGYRMRQSNVVPGYPPMYTTGIHLNDTAIHPELYLKHTFRAPEVESHAQQHESVDERGGPSNNTTMKIYNRDESD